METELNIDIIIEIQKGTDIKYKYDPTKKAMFCDKILIVSKNYHYNQGVIPNTLGENGNPLEVIILIDEQLLPGTYINCKFLGYLDTIENKTKNPIMIMCPSNKISTKYIEFIDINNSINILKTNSREMIRHFIYEKKQMEENKTLKIGEFYGKDDATQIFIEALTKFSNKPKLNSSKNKITNYFEKK
jgi:inorganic pyrophosphatase